MRPLLRAIAMDESERPITAAAEIAPLSENEDFKRESAVLARIGGEIAALDHQVQAIDIATYLETERKAGRNAAPDMVRAGSEIDLAIKIANGEDVDLRTGTEIAANARAKIEKLRPGYAAQRRRVEELRERLSAEACRALRERHRSVLRGLYQSCVAVSRAAAAERLLYAEIAGAGYVHMQHIMEPSQMGPAAAFDTVYHDSALNHFRRQLERLGVLPNGGA